MLKTATCTGEVLNGMTLVSSIGYNQDDIILNIMKLHMNNQPFDCDPTFSKGVFYRNLPEPRLKFDLHPQREDVVQADSRNLPIKNNELNSIMFDPPFLAKSGKGSKIKDRFGDYPTMNALWEFYADSLREFHRILRTHGVLVFKCQDTVNSGKNYLTHVEIVNMAHDIGFHTKDIFILLAKHRMPQWNMKQQRHARKYHSYFLVFEKRQPLVRYGATTNPKIHSEPTTL